MRRRNCLYPDAQGSSIYFHGEFVIEESSMGKTRYTV